MLLTDRVRRLTPGMATREAYGHTLAALGDEDPRIVVLDADLSVSTMTNIFGKKFPDRFVNVGVCEQNLIGIAAGLAACGKVPFTSSFAAFAPTRCYDQLRIVVAQPHTNVKLAASHAGVTTGPDGKSAQALEDVALMRSLHGFVVLVPADEVSAAWATRAAAAYDGPVYIRLGRSKAMKIYDETDTFEIGKAVQLAEGRDVTLIANGVMVAAALEAADTLQGEGIAARVLDLHCVAPLDRDAIERAARETGAIVVAEEHFLNGGTGEAVARAVAETYPAPMEFVGMIEYGISGEPAQLLEHFHLVGADIVRAARRVLERKGR